MTYVPEVCPNNDKILDNLIQKWRDEAEEKKKTVQIAQRGSVHAIQLWERIGYLEKCANELEALL